MIFYFFLSSLFEFHLKDNLLKIIFSFTIGFIYEGITLDIDNLTLPILIYNIYLLIN